MNSLNSIIIEGAFTAGVRISETQYDFIIESKRCYKNHYGKSAVKTIKVKIVCSGTIGDLCEKHLKPDCMIRAIGRLDVDKDDKKIVYAEHIELLSKLEVKKPVEKKIDLRISDDGSKKFIVEMDIDGNPYACLLDSSGCIVSGFDLGAILNNSIITAIQDMNK